VNPHDSTGIKFIVGFDDAELSFVSGVLENCALRKERLSRSVHVILHSKVDETGSLVLSCAAGRQYRLHNRVEVGGRHLIALTRRLHSTAALVAEYNDHRASQVLDSIFKTADAHSVGAIAGGAHYEQISQPLIKQNLRGHSTVGATQYSDFRLLTLCKRPSLLNVVVCMRFAADESLVSTRQLRPYLLCRRGLNLPFGARVCRGLCNERAGELKCLEEKQQQHRPETVHKHLNSLNSGGL